MLFDRVAAVYGEHVLLGQEERPETKPVACHMEIVAYGNMPADHGLVKMEFLLEKGIAPETALCILPVERPFIKPRVHEGRILGVDDMREPGKPRKHIRIRLIERRTKLIRTHDGSVNTKLGAHIRE